MAEVLRFGSKARVEVDSEIITVFEGRSLIFAYKIGKYNDVEAAARKAAGIIAPDACGWTEESVEDRIKSVWRRERSWCYAGVSRDGTMEIVGSGAE